MTTRLTTVSLVMVVAVVVCLIVAGGYLGYRLVTEDKSSVPSVDKEARPALKRMANQPEKKELVPPPPPPEYKSDAPILEQVRQALKDGISPSAAFDMAQTLPDGPERADAAFLLLEYAAETGHPQAAYLVAGYYDPTRNDPSGTIRKNPASAMTWYQEALAGGHPNARDSLERLHQWLGNKADQGSVEARDLLQQWPRNQP